VSAISHAEMDEVVVRDPKETLEELKNQPIAIYTQQSGLSWPLISSVPAQEPYLSRILRPAD